MVHKSVLLQEAIAGLDIDFGDVFVDATLGNGGHSEKVIEMFGESVRIIGIDADPDAIDRSKKRLAGRGRIDFINDDFRNINQILRSLSVEKVNKFLFDLGISSNQLEESGKGFSFLKDEPLLMTFGKPKDGELTAYEIVNYWSPKEMTGIFKDFGEEKYALRVANAVENFRKEKKIQSTKELVDVVKKALPKSYERGRIHPATRIFQALRFAVNDELGSLKEALPAAFEVLSSEGRIAVISFESLSDRIVKNFFREKVHEDRAHLITKKPLTASDDEIAINPRSRSAKLRVLEKI